MDYDMIPNDQKDNKKKNNNKKPKGSIVTPSPSHPKAPPKPNKGSKNT